jgi:hypothetical protein
MKFEAKDLFWTGVGLVLGLVLGWLAFANTVGAQELTNGNPCQTYLTHKDSSSWTEYGKASPLHYGYNKVNLEAKDLQGNTAYTFIRYPEPAPQPWPAGGWGIEVIASGTSNASGNLQFDVNYTLQQGEKYWMVPSSDLSGDKIVSWNPRAILFEHTTEFDSKCLAPVCDWGEWSECQLECGQECGEGTRVHYWNGDGCDNHAEYEKCYVECEISPTPIPEPTPTDKPKEEPKGTSEAGAPQCTDPRPVLLPANPLVWRRGDTAIVQWQPTEGNTANIYYYENQNPDNEHAVRDTENDGYVVIEGLSNLDWTFGVQQSNGCAGGDIVWIEDGGTSNWYLFTP